MRKQREKAKQVSIMDEAPTSILSPFFTWLSFCTLQKLFHVKMQFS